MKKLLKFLLVSFFLSTLTTCNNDSLIQDDEFTNSSTFCSLKSNKKQLMATGSLELTWNEKKQTYASGNKPENLRGFIDINAFQATEKQPAKGNIHYLITLDDLTIHREIYATVNDVLINSDLAKAYIIATVLYDSKECGSHSEEGHDSVSEELSSDLVDEENTGEYSEHDGGCSHEDTDEGVSTEDSGEDHTEGSTNHISGNNCRTGQIMVMQIYDGGSPGESNDEISWKWFSPEADNIPDLEYIEEWPRLCKKNIISGNSTVHF